MKNETRFRRNKVTPFLATLRNAAVFPIQQMALVGDPDYMICLRGKFIALELKDVGEIPRPLQQHKLDSVTRSGGLSLVCDETNFEWVKNLLEKLDKGES